jgi:TonB family protein
VALIFIAAGGFRAAERNKQKFLFQEIILTPSISAPVITEPVAPVQPPVTTPTQPMASPETSVAAQTPVTENPAETTIGPKKEDGPMVSTALGLGMTHGYFSSLADGRSLRNDIRGYYFEMVETINRAWWEKAGLLKEPLRQDGIFELLVQRDGTIVGIQILKSTGSREVDQLLADAIMKTSPLPAPPPTFDQALFRAPLRIKAPSFLFRLTN